MIILLVIVVTAIIYLVRYSQRPSQTPLLNKRRIVFFRLTSRRSTSPRPSTLMLLRRWLSRIRICRMPTAISGWKTHLGISGISYRWDWIMDIHGIFLFGIEDSPEFFEHRETAAWRKTRIWSLYIYIALTYSKVNLRSLSASRFVTSGWSKGILGMVIQAVSQVEQDMTPATVKHKKT